MNIKKDIVLRLRFVFLLILFFAIGIVWRIVQLQNIEGEKWRKESSRRYVSERTIEAVRGNIYADDGSLLATSLPKYRLGFDPLVSLSDKNKKIFEEGIEDLCKKLSNFYGDKDWKDYFQMINLARHEKDRYILLNNSLIDFQDVKMMKTWPIFKEGKYKGGVVFEKVNVRYNPFGKMGFRTIGYKKDKEKVGIENSFDSQLAGVPGKGIFEKIGQGSFRPIDGGEESIPIPGLDIHTTINVNIQDVAESSLLRALKRSGADKGCVVVMEVATGEIKAMTNLTRMRDTSNYAETYNHAVLGLTDPGSVFKLASMVALMEEWNLSNNELVETGDGKMKIGDKILEDSKTTGYGTITAQSVFEHSSNVGTAKLMLKYFGKGNEMKYYQKLHDFHLDQRLNFQLRPDAIPKISPPKKGDITGLPWNSIGYGMALTPLQMLTFYNAIANNGKWIQPIIVKETRVADKVEDDFKIKQEVDENPICSEETLVKVRKMLEGVVERGTASNIKNDLYKIAGKTGTSQKLINGKYRKGMYYTSFIGYFPADAPKYSCVVAIDNPRGVKKEALFASDASAPVFKEIADKIYACDIQMHKLLAKGGTKLTSQKQIAHTSDIKAINEEFGIEKMPSNEGWATMQAENGKMHFEEHRNPKNKVPDMRGMSLRDAIYVLENKGYKVSYKGIGRVSSQSIPPGSFATKNRTIGLVLN